MAEILEFDLIVIGSGPAGEKGAAQAAYFGKKVALIEKAECLGGAAANTGTLPSKTLRETALYLSGFNQRNLYGLEVQLKTKVTATDFLRRERQVVAGERARVTANMGKHNVEVFFGSASFTDPNTVSVALRDGSTAVLAGKIILIATGSHPRHPENYAFEDPRVYDSDEITDMHELPESIVVIGGGVIGCEYACMFAALGIPVTLLDKNAELLSFLDVEVAQSLMSRMRSGGVTLRMNETVTQVNPSPESIELVCAHGPAIKTHALLIAAGRIGNTEGLGLEAAGVTVDKRGQVQVNSMFQTTAPHIYAAGDVIGFPALASTSMEQARVAMSHAFGLAFKDNVAPVVPYGIYTIPECSMAGETEETLKEKRIPYIVGRASYGQNARGEIIGEKEGFLKLLVHAETKTVLGVHVIGEQATDLVHIGLMAILTAAPVTLFIEACFNYPTLSEMYKYATYDALGREHRGEIIQRSRPHVVTTDDPASINTYKTGLVLGMIAVLMALGANRMYFPIWAMVLAVVLIFFRNRLLNFAMFGLIATVALSLLQGPQFLGLLAVPLACQATGVYLTRASEHGTHG